jgi:BirA family biotin operon repressor/biotin-[acetyl-CoA-carboxylase] ligase
VVGGRLHYYESLDSTMDEARRLAERGSPEGTVVIAERQTRGRGRFDRRWRSPGGQGLLFSVVLRPDSDQLPFVNMAGTLAVSGAIADVTGLATSIKWPNDVRIRGRKVSGILIESVVESGEPGHAVLGVGINVNLATSRMPEIAATATSLYEETGRRTSRTAVMEAVLERLDGLYRSVKAGESLTAPWAERLETLGRWITVRWGERVIEGRAFDVDDAGNLWVSRADGSPVRVVAGEVTSQV